MILFDWLIEYRFLDYLMNRCICNWKWSMCDETNSKMQFVIKKTKMKIEKNVGKNEKVDDITLFWIIITIICNGIPGTGISGTGVALLNLLIVRRWFATFVTAGTLNVRISFLTSRKAAGCHILKKWIRANYSFPTRPLSFLRWTAGRWLCRSRRRI